jgi:hypothetical protein
MALTGVILSGLTIIVLTSVSDKRETTHLFDHNQVKLYDTHSAASTSKGTVFLLLVVGVIGVLGVSRKKKGIADSALKKESDRGS